MSHNWIPNSWAEVPCHTDYQSTNCQEKEKEVVDLLGSKWTHADF